MDLRIHCENGFNGSRNLIERINKNFMNIQSIILIAVLIIAALLALIFAVRHKTVSKCAGCTGDCSRCHGNFLIDKNKSENQNNEK